MAPPESERSPFDTGRLLHGVGTCAVGKAHDLGMNGPCGASPPAAGSIPTAFWPADAIDRLAGEDLAR